VIQHVTRQIQRSQLSACLRFYELLGYEQADVPQGIEGRAVWLAKPGADPSGPHLHLQFADDVQVPEQGHVAFVVAPYDETLESLSAAGFEVDRRREHWGSPRAYVRDPASNLVELMARAPGQRAQ
jgi:catechol 2,3-dioxygenase-like lactoylglutathione lyase family enzyme